MNFSLNSIKKLNKRKAYTIVGLLSIAVVYSAYKVFEDHPRVWSSYRGNSETNAYSPLTQINKNNVTDLEVAWQFGIPPATGAATGGGRFGGGGGQSNPVIVD